MATKKKVVVKNNLGKKFLVFFRYVPSLYGEIVVKNNQIAFYNTLSGGNEPMSYEEAVKYAFARTENNEGKEFYILEVQAKIERVVPVKAKYKVVKYVG